jgi:hypothetical protein
MDWCGISVIVAVPLEPAMTDDASNGGVTGGFVVCSTAVSERTS